MPTRKSTEAKPPVKGGDDDTPAKGTGRLKDGLGIEDLTLPRTMIQRLAKGVLPANTQIQKDALLAIHKSATVFVSYLADSANDRAVLANKKTIQPKDVLEALAELEFEGFLPRSEAELNLYNTIQCTKRNDYRRRVKNEKEAANESALPAASSGAMDGSDADEGATDLSPASRSNGLAIRDRDSPPAAKKARVSLAGNSTANGDVDEDEEEDGGDGEVEDEEDEELQVSDDELTVYSESSDPTEDEEDIVEGEEQHGQEEDQDSDEAEVDGDESE